MTKPYLPLAPSPANRLSNVAWALALIAVGALALAIRWYYVTHAVVYHPIRGDAVQYHAYAWNLAQHGVFSMAAPGAQEVTADSFRDPGYPVFLACLMKLFPAFDAWYAAVLTLQCLLGALTVVMLQDVGRGWLPDRWLIAAAVLMAVWPHSVTMTSYVLSETLFGFLCATAFWWLARGLGKPGWWRFAASGLAFGLAALTNAILLPFAALVAGALLWRRTIRPRLALALLLGSLALPAAWSVRNLQLPPAASSSGRALLNLVQGSWPEYHSAYRLAVNGDARGQQIMQAIGQESDLMLAEPAAGTRHMAARMGAAPLHYLAWYLSKPALLWGWSIRMGQGDIYVYPTVFSPYSENPAMRAMVAICQSINPLLMLLALAGLLLAIRRSTPGAIGIPVAMLAAYVTLVYSVLQAEPRYSIPFRGFECLLAAYALRHLALWMSNRKTPPAGETHAGA